MYQKFENILTRIGLFTTSECDEVLEWVEYNECGIALETICAIIEEKNLSVDENIKAELLALGRKLNIDCWIFNDTHCT